MSNDIGKFLPLPIGFYNVASAADRYTTYLLNNSNSPDRDTMTALLEDLKNQILIATGTDLGLSPVVATDLGGVPTPSEVQTTEVQTPEIVSQPAPESVIPPVTDALPPTPTDVITPQAPELGAYNPYQQYPQQ